MGGSAVQDEPSRVEQFLYKFSRRLVHWQTAEILPMVNRITYDPKVMGGRACFRGMRITVALVVNLMANGMTIEEILREYPDLEPEDIHQTLAYASALANEEVHLFPSPAA